MARVVNHNATQMLDFVKKTSLFVEDFCKHDHNQTGKLCKIMRDQKKFGTHNINNVLHQEDKNEAFFSMDSSTFVFEEMDNSEEVIDFVKNYSPIFDIMWLLATIDEDDAKKLIQSLDSPRSDFLIGFKEQYRQDGRPDNLLPQTILRLWIDFAKDAKVSETGDTMVVNMSTNTNDFVEAEQKKYLAFLSLFEVSDGSRQFRFIFDNNGNNIFNKGIHDIQRETAGSIETSQFRTFLQHSESTALQVLRDVSNMFGINMCVFSKVYDDTMANECKPYFTNQYAKTCFMLRFQNYDKPRQVTNSDDGFMQRVRNMAQQAIDNGAQWALGKLFGKLELRLVFALKTKRFVRDDEIEKRANKEKPTQMLQDSKEKLRHGAMRQQMGRLEKLKKENATQIKQSTQLNKEIKELNSQKNQYTSDVQAAQSNVQTAQVTLNTLMNEIETSSFANDDLKHKTTQARQRLNDTTKKLKDAQTRLEELSQKEEQKQQKLEELSQKQQKLDELSQPQLQEWNNTINPTFDASWQHDRWHYDLPLYDYSTGPTVNVDSLPYNFQLYDDLTEPTRHYVPCKDNGLGYSKESLTAIIRSLSNLFRDSDYRDLDALSECCCAMIHKQDFTLANIQLPEATFHSMLEANPTMDWIMGLRGLAMSPAFGVIITNLEGFEHAINIVNQNGGFKNLHPGFAMFQNKIGNDEYSTIFNKIKDNKPVSKNSHVASSPSEIQKVIRSLRFPLQELNEYERKSIYYSILPQFPHMTIEEFNNNPTYLPGWPLTYSAFLHVGGDTIRKQIEDIMTNPNRTTTNPTINKSVQMTLTCKRVRDQPSPLGYKLIAFTHKK